MLETLLIMSALVGTAASVKSGQEQKQSIAAQKAEARRQAMVEKARAANQARRQQASIQASAGAAGLSGGTIEGYLAGIDTTLKGAFKDIDAATDATGSALSSKSTMIDWQTAGTIADMAGVVSSKLYKKSPAGATYDWSLLDEGSIAPDSNSYGSDMA